MSFVFPDRRARLSVSDALPWLIVLGFIAAAAVVTLLAIRHPLPVAAALGGLAVISLAWRWPAAALALIFACAPWTTDISGGVGAKFGFGEVVLVLCLPVFYVRCLILKRLPSTGPLAVPVFLYFGVCALSSSAHWVGNETITSLLQMFLYLVVAVAVFAKFTTREEDLLLALYSLVASGAVLSLCAMATHYTCFGQNKNSIGDPLASAFLVCIILLMSQEGGRRTRALLLAALVVLTLGLFLSLSRGSWIGASLGLLMITALKREYRRLLYILLAVVPLIILCWRFLPDDSKAYATGFGTDRYNIEARFDSVNIAEKYYLHNPLYGYGVGLRKDFDATNLIMVTLAETGWLGVICLTLIHVVFFSMVWQTQRRIHKTDPMHALLCIGAALVLSRLAHGMVDHYWTRSVLMLAWGGAGMTTAVYFAVRNRPPLKLAAP